MLFQWATKPESKSPAAPLNNPPDDMEQQRVKDENPELAARLRCNRAMGWTVWDGPAGPAGPAPIGPMPDGLSGEDEIAWISERLIGRNPAPGSPVWAYRKKLADRQRARNRTKVARRRAGLDPPRPKPTTAQPTTAGGTSPAERDHLNAITVGLCIGGLGFAGVIAMIAVALTTPASTESLLFWGALVICGVLVILGLITVGLAYAGMPLPAPGEHTYFVMRRAVKIGFWPTALVALVFLGFSSSKLYTLMPKSATRAETTTATSTPAKQPARTMVNATPAKILTLCDGYTARKCDKLNSAYRGKWVRWTGVVEAVGVGDNPTVFLTMPFPQDHILGTTTVIVDFNGNQHDELIRVRQGDKITVLGRIRDSIYMNSVIDLEDSELLNNETVDKEKP